MKSYHKMLISLVLFCMILTCIPQHSLVNAATLKTVKVGKVIELTEKGATNYVSSDPDVAYVNANGRVTGKKQGQVTISFKKNGKTKEQVVAVTKNAKKPGIKVCVDEIEITDVKIKALKNDLTKTKKIDSKKKVLQTYRVYVTVKNHSKNTVRNVVLNGKVASQNVEFTFNAIKADKQRTKAVDIKVYEELEEVAIPLETEKTETPTASEVEETTPTPTMQTKLQVKTKEYTFKATNIEVYSRSMVSVYSFLKDKLVYNYATEDTVAPVISGFIGKDSYNKDCYDEIIPYQVVYKDEAFDYFKYVTAEDDRDTKVTLTVDTSKVDFSKKGVYTITYIATDEAGNVSKATAKLGVRVNDSLDKMAASVLKQIIKDDWTDEKKARAIYQYTRSHVAYSGDAEHTDWEYMAKRGMQKGQGDCYGFYAVARILLTRAGIPNIEVTRVKGEGHHWWNMTFVNGEWYHFDCCPRRVGGTYCLLTDSQLTYFSENYGHDSHIWAYDKKPKSSTKKISKIF